jgi:glycosyltransferase involved in cell wall biosynthesis
MKRPIISVIVPAYNEENYISKCLSALGQQVSAPPYEVIVINNCSTDGTVQVAKQFNVRIVDEECKGIVHAKQRGFDEARGDIVAVIDSDSIPPPDWVSQIHYSLSDQKYIAVTGPYVIKDGPKFHVIYVKVCMWFVKTVYKLTHRLVYAAGGNVAFRKNLFKSLGGYDTRINWGEDEFGLLAKLNKNGKICFNPKMQISTSGRRATKGFLYFVYELVTLCFGYFVNKLFKHEIITSRQDFR